jgi:3-hydroxyisobutyrate dehydrogenase
VIADASTVSAGASEVIRAAANSRGADFLATPVSGNPTVIAAGKLTVVVSGPREVFDSVEPVLRHFGRGVTYVGDGEVARLVKIAHNVMLGVVTQCLAEVTVLVEKDLVSRSDFLAFLNDSVMGSAFTQYKSPAFVNLDFTPTFTMDGPNTLHRIDSADTRLAVSGGVDSELSFACPHGVATITASLF